MNREDIQDVYDIIKEMYDFPNELKEQQMSAVEHLLARRNVFALLPTGYGKSMIYTIIPLVLDQVAGRKGMHMTVVITPLKSLMEDQVNQASIHGIQAFALPNHKLNKTQEQAAMAFGEKGSLLYMSPELASGPDGQQLITRIVDIHQKTICLLALDEAHCITKWGQEFRPAYGEIGLLRSFFPDSPVLCCTATATKDVLQDIFRRLGLDDTVTETIGVIPDRPNIFMDIRKCSRHFEEELSFLVETLKEKKLATPKTIIYCRNISTTSEVWAYLDEEASGVERIVEMFHASTPSEKQHEILNNFRMKDSKIRVLVSTIAFGMGVSIPDIRLVIHFGAPGDIMNYAQEMGRAGRDGQPSMAIMLAHPLSMIPRLCSQDIRDLINRSKEGCVRETVLIELSSVLGYADDTIKKVTKYNCPDDDVTDVDILCSCRACQCCTYCVQHCACSSKTEDATSVTYLKKRVLSLCEY